MLNNLQAMADNIAVCCESLSKKLYLCMLNNANILIMLMSYVVNRFQKNCIFAC